MRLSTIGNIGKGLYHGTGEIVRRDLNRCKPHWLYFDVTDRCNSRCQTCNIWRKKPEKELPPWELARIFTDPIFSDVSYIINSGGEITVRDDLEDLLLVEHRAFPKATIQISTNGLRPDVVIKIVGRLLSRGTKVDLGISLDAVGDEHDRIRGVKGNFEKIDYLINSLKDLMFNRYLSVGVGTTLTPLIFKHYESVRHYAQQKGVGFVFHWFDANPFYDNVNGTDFDREHAEMLKALACMPNDVYHWMWRQGLKGKRAKFTCFALHKFLSLHPNGNVSPCLHYWNDVVGNVSETLPSEIWRSDEMWLERQKIRDCFYCLNNWCVNWSIQSYYYPIFRHWLRKKVGRA